VSENLNDLWDLQQKFAEMVCMHFNGKSLALLEDSERVEESKEYALQIVGEIPEVLNTFNWKRHRVAKTGFNRAAMMEEFVDLQKFLWGWMQQWSISKGELHNAFVEKSKVVDFRWKQEKGEVHDQLLAATKVAVVDIDGVLNTYPNCFREWVLKEYPDEDIRKILAAKQERPLVWGEWKDEYRRSGAKRRLGVRAYAKDLLFTLQKLDYFVVIATNRPVKTYPSLFYDTMVWLEINNLEYDYLHCVDVADKLVYLKDILPKVDVVIDDNEGIVSDFRSQGIAAFYVTQETDLREVTAYIRERHEKLKKWDDTRYATGPNDSPIGAV